MPLGTREICGNRGISGVLQALDAEILDHCVREQFAAHLLDVAIAGAVGEVELDQLAGADVIDPAKAEPFERVVDGLALRVEYAGLEGDEDSRFHGIRLRNGSSAPLWLCR